MRLITLLLTLLITCNAHAFGLWGSADLGLGNVASKKQLRAETVAYCLRVVADGGVCVDTAAVDKYYSSIASFGATPVAAYMADGGLKKDAGGAVSKWYSLSTATYDLIQATGANQPIWSIGGDGKTLLTFDGSNDSIQRVFTLNQPTNLYTVLAPTKNQAGFYVFDGKSAINSMGLITADTTGKLMANAGTNSGQTGAFLNQYHQLSVLFSGANSYFRADGSTIAGSGNLGAANAGGLVIGQRQDGAASAGSLSREYILFDAPATATAVESYLKTKWGTP